MDETWEVDTGSTLLPLLERAIDGEPITVLRNGEIIGTLIPQDRGFDRTDATAAMRNIIEMSDGATLGGLRFKDLAHAGHKY